jgi:hypothetical protein
MPATIQRESNNTYLLTLSGTVLRSEFGAVQNQTAPDIDTE